MAETLSMPEAGFDYASLTPPARAVARKAVTTIKHHEQRSAESLIAIGAELVRVKGVLARGEFLAWLGEEFAWNEDTCERVMQGARLKDRVPQIAELPIDISALYVLARPSTPEPVREIALERAAVGERVTHATVKAHAERLKREKAGAPPALVPVVIEPPAGDPDELPLPFGAMQQPAILVPVDQERPAIDPDEVLLPAERAGQSPAPAAGPAEGCALDPASELAALHERLTARHHDARKAALAVPPALRGRYLDEVRRVLAWLEDHCTALENAVRGLFVEPARRSPDIAA